MLGFIYNNQSLFIILCVIAFLVVLYFIVKAAPAKTSIKSKKVEAKSADKDSENIEKKSDETDDLDKIKSESEEFEKTQKKEEKNKKDDKKPKIVQIYKREQRDTNEKNSDKQVTDPIYDRNVEFVNTSKNIAKFKSFAEEKKEEPQVEVEGNDEFGFVIDSKEDCEFCEDHVKHFDHSRRLKTIVNNEDDSDMFGSHISEKYMNINSDRHLNLNEKFNQNLFAMTERMMNNSKNKVKVESDSDCDCRHSCCDEDMEDDEVKINMKTALIADTYFHRKKKK